MTLHLKHKTYIIIVKLLLCISLCLTTELALAWNSVTILTTNDTSSVNDFVRELKQEVDNIEGVKVNLSKSDSGLSINIPKDTIVVAVGTQALKYASNLDEHTPVIGVLVPKSSYENILIESKRKPNRFSAIYLDQPFSRQLALIKAIFPNITRIGVLLGPVSQFQSNDLQSAAKKSNLEVDIQLVEKPSELHENLEKVTAGKEVLLAIPDPLIYTRDTAQTILLTTYRRQAPVIGFSKSYARSGAIAAVFSSPKQYASEVAKTIKSLPRDYVSLPPASASSQFSIEINRQVARSLDIRIADDETIYQQILGDEK